MAVDSIEPDVPALRIIPASRLLPGDELWGWRFPPTYRRWRLWVEPVSVLKVAPSPDWRQVTIAGWEVDSGKHVTRNVGYHGDVLITFRTNAFAVKGDDGA